MTNLNMLALLVCAGSTSTDPVQGLYSPGGRLGFFRQHLAS